MTSTSGGRGGPGGLRPEDRDQPAGRAFALVLGDLLDELRRLEPEVLAGDDPEALHDYRVVLRRARTVLRAGERVYPPEELELLQALTSGLADATSPVRDLDVLLEDLDGLAQELSPELHDGVERIRAELRARRLRARTELLEQLRGDEHPVLLRRWQVMASVHRLGGSDPGPDALRPTGDVVDDLVRDAYQRLVRGGRRRMASEDPAQWHTVRKRAKRLRYLLGAFSGLHADGALDPLAARLAKLQDAFGALQDHVVQAELVEQVGLDLGGRATLAAGALSDHLHLRAHEDLGRCRTQLRKITRKKVRRAVRDALGAGAGSA